MEGLDGYDARVGVCVYAGVGVLAVGRGDDIREFWWVG